jgi:hypothetical protein
LLGSHYPFLQGADHRTTEKILLFNTRLQASETEIDVFVNGVKTDVVPKYVLEEKIQQDQQSKMVG